MLICSCIYESCIFMQNISYLLMKNHWRQFIYSFEYFDLLWFLLLFYSLRVYKMTKELNYFKIDGVQYWLFREEMTAKQIREFLKIFRKQNRPSSSFVNALLQIQQLQHCVENQEHEIDRILKEKSNENKMIVFYWFALIIWIIVFWFWSRTIINLLIDLFK